MNRNLSFRLPDDAQNLVKREAGGLSACDGAWQRVARRRWRDHLLSWLGWYPWQCTQCHVLAYYRRR